MGSDASWYLRFSRTDRQVFWVSPGVVPQLENALYVETDWTLTMQPVGEYVRAEFVRKRRP
ncbi:hypothetical protein [Desulfomicrobium salsuginis]